MASVSKSRLTASRPRGVPIMNSCFSSSSLRSLKTDMAPPFRQGWILFFARSRYYTALLFVRANTAGGRDALGGACCRRRNGGRAGSARAAARVPAARGAPGQARAVPPGALEHPPGGRRVREVRGLPRADSPPGRPQPLLRQGLPAFPRPARHHEHHPLLRRRAAQAPPALGGGRV